MSGTDFFALSQKRKKPEKPDFFALSQQRNQGAVEAVQGEKRNLAQAGAQLRAAESIPAPEVAGAGPLGDVLPEATTAGAIKAVQGVVDYGQGMKRAYSHVPKDVRSGLAAATSLFPPLHGAVLGMNAVIGDDTPEDVQKKTAANNKLYKQLDKDYPTASMIGRNLGQTVPMLASPGSSALGMVKAFYAGIARVATAAGIGAGQAAVVSAGIGKEAEEVESDTKMGAMIGGIIQAALPNAVKMFSFIGQKIHRKAGEMFDETGAPTPAMAEAMEREGVTVDSMTDDVIEALQSNGQLDEATALRKMRFDAQKVKYTRGDITQLTEHKKAEAQSLESSSDMSKDLQAFRAQQARDVFADLDEIVGTRVTREETGMSVRGALLDRRDALDTEINSAYLDLEQAARGAGGDVRVPSEGIAESFRQNPVLRDNLDELDGTRKGLLRVLRDYKLVPGVNKPPEGIPGVGPKDLTIGELENLRQAVGAVRNSEKGNRAAIAHVITAIDSEADRILQGAESGASGAILEQAKKARALYRARKIEYPDDGIIVSLIGRKGSDKLPVVEASKVMSKLYSTEAPPEVARRILDTLKRSGVPGRRAIQNMQTSIAMDVAEESMKSSSRVVNGQQLPNAAAYNKRLENLNKRGALDELFSNDPVRYKRLKDSGKTQKDITPGTFEAVKGSGNVILDMISPILNAAPGLRMALPFLKKASRDGLTMAQTRAALRADPRREIALKEINQQWPAIGKALGINYMINEPVEQ